MDNQVTFDPLAWVNKSDEQAAQMGSELQTVKSTAPTAQCQSSSPADELAKATATVEELLRMGANIAESYEDYLTLGFALADGLGSEGRDLYHRLCAQSTKYSERDCERKWRECLSKHDGRTTIASFYKMAQQSGVDLSEISRSFPSKTSNPHRLSENNPNSTDRSGDNTKVVYNKNVIDNNPSNETVCATFQNSGEGMREVRETGLPTDESELPSAKSRKTASMHSLHLCTTSR